MQYWPKLTKIGQHDQNIQSRVIHGASIHDGTTMSNLKCRNLNVLAISCQIGQKWPILSNIELVVAQEPFR